MQNIEAAAGQMTTLIERLSKRAHDPERAVDERLESTGGKATVLAAAPAATDEQVAAAERLFGFVLPPLLRTVYQKVGNGGFGPGYGLFALDATTTHTKTSLVTNYTALIKAQTRPPWPTGLVSLCEWGAGIGSYLDCTHPELTIVRIDPNMPKADVTVRVPERQHYSRAAQVKDACWIEAVSLEEWLSAWADGSHLFYLAYGTADSETDEDDEIIDDDE